MTTADAAAVRAATYLFDHETRPEWVTRFLTRPGHHLCIAYVDGEPVGFVSAVEMDHPDKGTEMFLYELGVDDGFQRRGIGGALVAALADLARDRGCYGMWVLTDSDNTAAVRTYQSTGATDLREHALLTWRFKEDQFDQDDDDGPDDV